jgi:predicted methyltransferase
MCVYRYITRLLLYGSLLVGLAHAAVDSSEVLDQAIASAHRTAAFKVRDRYRHPKETLVFFGFRPDMHVVEIWPGGGYYTEILAPVLRSHGRYYAAHFHVDDKAPAYARSARQSFLEKLAREPALYDRTVVTSVQPQDPLALAPKGSIDLVLTFRNVHNWLSDNSSQTMFRAFYDVLKPGGVLGVVEHRAREGTSVDNMKRSGYVAESYVVRLAENAGFELAGRSEINANPRDTKDYPGGVWTLPPTLRLGNVDRDKYLQIGESDRMTLKFVKR